MNDAATTTPFTLWSRQWGWRMIALVVLGGTRAWWFVHYELAPEIAQQLQQRLNRPVEIGGVEHVGLNVVRFGSSAVPSYTPEDGTPELDNALINGIEVAFNPWQLLTGQKLDLDVTLHQPQLTVVQDAQGRWWRTEVQLPEEEPSLFQLNQIKVKVRDGSVLVQPFRRPAYLLHQIHGGLTLTPDRQNFALEGQAEGQLAGVANGDCRGTGTNPKNQDNWICASVRFPLGSGMRFCQRPFVSKAANWRGNYGFVCLYQKPPKSRVKFGCGMVLYARTLCPKTSRDYRPMCNCRAIRQSCTICAGRSPMSAGRLKAPSVSEAAGTLKRKCRGLISPLP